MYLKKIEVKGFKSFANKLELDFNQGITTIVGPNGSGKSNIVDAVRWVLGEQSIKTLRGSKNEEVIFAGTENRKPLGFAEVSLVLDNSMRTFNSDFEEIKITRCLYRSGESEYKINESNCRLKDIYDVFLNTGIGKEGYSIIGQGKIDEILSAKPKERRSFFEEAAGISKSRLDLNETTKKLDDERQNLVRVNDIISELEKQIEPLKLQSEKAEVFLEYKEKLKKFEVKLFTLDIEKYKEEFDQINMEYESLVMDVEEKSENLEFSKEEKKKVSNILMNIRNEIERKQNELNRLDLLIEQKKSNKVLIGEKIANAKNNIEMKREFIQKHENMILTKRKVIDSDNVKFLEIKNNHDEKKRIFEEENKTLQKSNQIIESKENELEEIKQKIVDNMNLVFTYKTEIQDYDNRIANILEGNSNLLKQNESVDLEINKLENENISYQDSKNKVLESEKLLASEYEILVQKHNSKVNELNDAIEAKHKLENETKAISSKLEVLEHMERNFEGMNKGVKEVLVASKEEKINGVHSTVSEVINVDKKYEIAMQVAMGARLQNVIVENEVAAKQAINYLKAQKSGRATFLPLTATSNFRNVDVKKIKEATGYIGLASELITAGDKYDKVVKGLVSNIVIVDTVDNAIKISSENKYMYNIVTLTGEQFSNNGSITGGEYKNQINLLSRSREICDLKEEVVKLNNQISEKINLIDNCKSESEEITLVKEEKNNALQQLRIEKMKIDEKINNMQNELERLNASKNDDDEQRALYKSQEKMYIDLKEEKTLEFENLEKSIEEEKEKVEKFKEAIEIEKEIRNIKNEEIIDMKVLISSLEKEMTLHETTIKVINDEIAMLEEEKENGFEMIRAYEKEIEEFNKQIGDIFSDTSNEELERESVRTSLEASKKELALREKEQLELDETITKLQSEKEEVNVELYKTENKKNTIALKLENIRQKLMESYGITYDQAKDMIGVELEYQELQTRAREYRGKISALGNVNVDSIEQYKEIQSRYEFMKKQRDDVLLAEEELKVLMNHLLTEMRNKFSSNLSKINEKFDLVFKELFGGGTAYIELTDSEDVLEAGIELIVSPPGKKVQNLSLLSGGERALVAIALLFGILELKPSPFCILDEIEAALDEANVTRFATYIKKLSKQIQFLVITHRSGTMEFADFMYGVTMEEKGISKVVSLQLGNKEYANDTLPEENGERVG